MSIVKSFLFGREIRKALHVGAHVDPRLNVTEVLPMDCDLREHSAQLLVLHLQSPSNHLR
jgi:hypothetical protein